MNVGPCPYCWNDACLTDENCAVCHESLVVLGRFRLLGVTTASEGASAALVRHWDAVALDGGERVTVTATDGLGTHRPEAEFEVAARLLEHLSAGCSALPDVRAADREHRRSTLGQRFFLVREALPAPTLETRIAEGHARPTEENLRVLARGLASALEALHGRLPPVVHGDLAPCHVAFRSEHSWEPVLLGLEIGAGLSSVAPPVSAEVVAYAPPERLAGRPLTPAVDRYGLVASLHYAMTGAPPTRPGSREGRPVDALEAVLATFPEPLRSELARLVEGGAPGTSESLSGLPLGAPSSARPDAPLVLRLPDGSELTFNLRTPLTRRLLRSLGDDTRFLDAERQATLEPREDGWYVVPNPAAPNETLVNGDAVVAMTRLSPGDVLAVGRAAKGVAKLPLQVIAAG